MLYYDARKSRARGNPLETWIISIRRTCTGNVSSCIREQSDRGYPASRFPVTLCNRLVEGRTKETRVNYVEASTVSVLLSHLHQLLISRILFSYPESRENRLKRGDSIVRFLDCSNRFNIDIWRILNKNCPKSMVYMYRLYHKSS